MKIYLSDLKKEEGNYVSYNYRVDPKTLKLESTGFCLEEPVTLQVSAAYNGRDVFIEGTFYTHLNALCSRCLTEFSFPLEGEFQDKFQHQNENSQEKEKDAVESFFEGDVFNLRALLQETIILSLPLKPLCISHCQGLCPVCGSNLNIEKCGCETAGIDPRLEELKNFFKK